MSDEASERDPTDLVRRADMALNDSKRSGRGMVRVFDERMDEGIRVRRWSRLAAEAIVRDELTTVFQPIVGRGDLGIAGFEATVAGAIRTMASSARRSSFRSPRKAI